MYTLIALAVLMLLLTVLTAKLYKYFLLSPIHIYLIFNYLIIVLTVLYYYFYEDKISFYNVDKATNSDFLNILRYYIVANISFLAATVIYYDYSIKSNKLIFNTKLDYTLFNKYVLPKRLLNISMLLVLIIFLCYAFTYGKGIMFRVDYIPEFENKFLISIAKILSFLTVILLGLFYSDNKTKSSFGFVVVLLLNMSTGSRATFLLLLIYLLIVFQTSGNTKKNKIRFFFQLVFAFIFMAYVLSLRKLADHGLIPYIASIFSEDESGIRDSIAFNTYYTFIFGFFATIRTVNEAARDWYIIFVSLNPLPGSMVGWYNYAPLLRLNVFAPYTLHGQVFNMGMTFTCAFFFILGLIFSYFEKIVRALLINNKRGMALVLVLLLSLFLFYSYEYYLRSAFRYIYYAYFVLLIYQASSYFFKRKKNQVKS
ncbi:hypothetical protein SAMN04515667_0553 [Formosa sp. Hel1_31_208]|uniref:hypothetical protein n=1 Tax=Formosa sp. Hel1_31_208 TaxID=1798225 RepID=UPI000879E003|nr:hypothetical protein [Formosa sp. Hel1_31_208]SDR75359.1 hypothetical protein SAMN04515667_0553 [Formosa sp. Hel1_31_208]